jgi:peroxiredoxin
MVPFSKTCSAVGEGRPMLKPLVACLFAIAFTMPGCGKTEPPAPAPPPDKGLRAGQPAPEIEGIDLDGSPITLSEFRGKVVALSFWANWCRYCVELFPHEKLLVEELRDHPFVLLGANGDEPLAAAKKAQEKHQLPWRSIYVEGAEGPIAAQYGVSVWPTIYLIDAKGTIRYRFEGASPQAVERAIRALLREMGEEGAKAQRITKQ